MDCSCEVSCPLDEEHALDMGVSYIEASTSSLTCDECGRTIEEGETYLYEHGTLVDNIEKLSDGDIEEIPEEEWQHYNTCLDCKSIRDQFFPGSWIYGSILDELYTHLDLNLSPTEGAVDEKCLAALTPRAREKVCELIEDVWKSMEDD